MQKWVWLLSLCSMSVPLPNCLLQLHFQLLHSQLKNKGCNWWVVAFCLFGMFILVATLATVSTSMPFIATDILDSAGHPTDLTVFNAPHLPQYYSGCLFSF